MSFIAAMGLLLSSCSDDMFSPYVSISEARSNPGKYFQIMGGLDTSKPVTHEESSFTFTLLDESNSTVTVRHTGVKPYNFEHADQIVVLGRYQKDSDLFEADKLLVKCPSKYEKQVPR